MKNAYDESDWLTQRLDALRPGWRGRLHLSVPEELHAGAASEVIGTVVEEPAMERDPADDGITDAFVTFCPNYRDGRFLPTLDEPTIAIRASRITDIEAM
jgi:hypothetical protein